MSQLNSGKATQNLLLFSCTSLSFGAAPVVFLLVLHLLPIDILNSTSLMAKPF